jgi:hypothetical protein
MPADHEYRRRAIIEAFREARLPPLERRVDARLSGIEQQLADLAAKVHETADRVEEIDLTSAAYDDDEDEEDSPLDRTPSIPSVTSPGLMSAVASLALFGHQ